VALTAGHLAAGSNTGRAPRPVAAPDQYAAGLDLRRLVYEKAA
jgi:hypothetical protein